MRLIILLIFISNEIRVLSLTLKCSEVVLPKSHECRCHEYKFFVEINCEELYTASIFDNQMLVKCFKPTFNSTLLTFNTTIHEIEATGCGIEDFLNIIGQEGLEEITSLDLSNNHFIDLWELKDFQNLREFKGDTHEFLQNFPRGLNMLTKCSLMGIINFDFLGRCFVITYERYLTSRLARISFFKNSVMRYLCSITRFDVAIFTHPRGIYKKSQ